MYLARAALSQPPFTRRIAKCKCNETKAYRRIRPCSSPRRQGTKTHWQRIREQHRDQRFDPRPKKFERECSGCGKKGHRRAGEGRWEAHSKKNSGKNLRKKNLNPNKGEANLNLAESNMSDSETHLPPVVKVDLAKVNNSGLATEILEWVNNSGALKRVSGNRQFRDFQSRMETTVK